MASESITLELILEEGNVTKVFKKVGDEAQDAGKKAGDNFEKGFSSGLGLLAKAIAGVGATLAGAFAVGKAVEAANQQEDAINSLNIALKLTGRFTDETSKGFQDLASSLQASTGVADDVILQNTALIQNMANLDQNGLKRATTAALDLSAALGKDLTSASEMIAKAANGNVSAFQKLGIEIRKGSSDAETFANTLQALERFQGSAAAKTQTFSGSVLLLQNSFGDLLEEIGFLITRSPVVQQLLQFVALEVQKLAGFIQKLGEGGDIFAPLVQSLSVFGFVVQLVTVPIDVLWGHLQRIGMTIGALGASIATLATGNIAGVGEIFKQLNQDVQGTFNFNVTEASQSFITRLQEFMGQVKPAVQVASQQLASTATQTMIGQYGSFWQQAGAGFKGFFKTTEQDAKGFTDRFTQNFQGAFQNFAMGFGQAFASMGQALAQGQNGLEALGKGLLGAVGDLAIQIGSFAFLAGLATFNFAQVGLGLALLTLGGVLKGVAASKPNPPPAGMSESEFNERQGGGGLSIAATSVDNPAATGNNFGSSAGEGLNETQGANVQFRDEERVQRGPNIQVNVQGNVLDRRQTGLELVEVINEAFGSNDTQLLQASTGA